MLFGSAVVSVGEDLLSGNDVLLKHLTEENVVDFDVMCRQTVVQETWWEHHVVSLEPELGSILGIKDSLVSLVLESASSQNHHGAPEIAEQSGVVEWSIAQTSQELAAMWSSYCVPVESLYPEVVDNLECSEEGVGAVLSFADLQVLENSTNETWSGGESLVNEVLETTSVFKDPVLKP